MRRESAILHINLFLLRIYHFIYSQKSFYLPSYNCGACGHVNCRQVAKEIVEGKIKDIKICKVISKDNSELIKEYCKNNNIEIE